MTDTRTETSLQAGLKKSTFQLFLATGAWVGSTSHVVRSKRDLGL